MSQGQKVIEAKPKSKTGEPQLMGLIGAALLALAGFFMWRELALQNEVLAVAGAVCAAGAAVLAHRKGWAGVGPIALVVSGVVCGAWYGATKEPVVLIGVGVAFAASVALMVPLRKRFSGEAAKLHRMMAWLGTVLNGVIGSFGLYFLVFDATESSLNGFIARRSLLTLVWLVSGAVMVVTGRQRDADEIRIAGLVALACAMSKLLLYDLSHTDGVVRIGALAIGGAVMLGASQLSRMLGKVSAS